ncbi:meiotic recombination protein REC114 isoform X2 [Ahaetulla prasina]|uniref:meiotic recombination protein REC114 isoform X2 n=1 Tax=Ahaetulla prasina TaxID=499056 RepID=UPI002647218B|nr:meiotic recombination protein REC114 isoform X2 [Ahaetulla prasina]
MATGSNNAHILNNCDPASWSEVDQPLLDQMTEQSRDTSCLKAAEWPLRRYGRFMPGALGTASGSWKVLESNEESGFLVLSIVISGHFFISRGKEVLSKHRMFRIQFIGDSKTEAEEHCHNCMQKLAEYIPIQMTDALRQELHQSHSLLLTDESQLKDIEQNVLLQDTVVNVSPTHGTMSVAELAQCVLIPDNQLPLAYQKSTWNAEDLSSFIRLCLLDQNFPAFVEEVEKQLKKIIDG